MKINFWHLLTIFSIAATTSYAHVLTVGSKGEFADIQEASAAAVAGDTILVETGVYKGGIYIHSLRGEDLEPIVILSETPGQAIIRGGSNAIHFVKPANIILQGFIFEQQLANGVNIDDGGDYNTEPERIIVRNCTFRDMQSSGNNDLLKISGIDDFEIINCTFENGAAGGSGIDMVGCHNGTIKSNRFINMGSNAIQAKGGTQHILIEANYFKNCGQRTLNLGGSTGLEYFRPIDATFEAADLSVFSNIIIGSVAPIAYVGSTRVKVVNNTIINPEKWVIRILQETVDEERFVPSSNGTFANNIVYLGDLHTTVNIGSNTSAESFSFENNFWYNYENEQWQGPNLPTDDLSQVISLDPQFVDFGSEDFHLVEGSPAASFITWNNQPNEDFYANSFRNPRSAGAIERIPTSAHDSPISSQYSISPLPASEYLDISISNETNDIIRENRLNIYDIMGRKVLSKKLAASSQHRIEIRHIPPGVYLLQIQNKVKEFIIIR